MPRPPEFLRFCLVGFTGYLVDAGALELLVHHGWATFIARVFSILIALQVTYLLHGFFTFKNHRGFGVKSWLHFMAANAIGAAINYMVFLLALHTITLQDAVLHRQLALVCGTAIALFFNYWANRRFVFKAQS